MKKINKKPVLIIVSGAPASGKTALSKLIAKEFGFAVFNKDEFKEILSDVLGYDGIEQVLRYGTVSFRLINHIVNVMMRANVSFVIEANFDGRYSLDFFKDIENKGEYQLLQLFCDAPVSQLYERSIECDKSNDRHPCHKVRDVTFGDYERDYLAKEYRLDLVNTININTSDFEKINYDLIFNKIKDCIN